MATIIPFKEHQISFEDFKNENGASFWWASDVMKMVGYTDMKSFKKVLDRATKACITLGINHYDNFRAEMREVNGALVQDFKLSRFACYLTVMNGDPKKTEVAKAQVYFIELTRRFELYIQNNEDIERLLIRDELREGNKSLSGVAKKAGVTDYAKFQNAGYRGLYNMMNWELARHREIQIDELIEYMGRTELAANLFRITQTEERIKNNNIVGQINLEQTHYDVSREVRRMVEKNTGRAPEQLPREKKIPEIHKELKSGYKKMLQEENETKKSKSKKK
jgi:DNA-damage-inducible protein D